MEKRIRELMEAQELSPSKFAEAIGVQRSNISHILSGRNKPSLELINKILDTYPQVNTDWLLLGKGPLFTKANKAAKETVDNKTSAKSGASFSFDHDQLGADSETQLTSAESGSRKAVKIVVFYSDQSFEEFHPKDV